MQGRISHPGGIYDVKQRAPSAECEVLGRLPNFEPTPRREEDAGPRGQPPNEGLYRLATGSSSIRM